MVNMKLLNLFSVTPCFHKEIKHQKIIYLIT
jgi:hypothetical protein